jgi:hypothetical protein
LASLDEEPLDGELLDESDEEDDDELLDESDDEDEDEPLLELDSLLDDPLPELPELDELRLSVR